VRPAIYLDYNATAPLRPEARTAIEAALDETGNPSSVHRFGRNARARVEAARGEIAALAGCAPGELIFTSGGTEANNLALAACGRTRLLVSDIEHDSVLAAAPEAERIPARADGRVDLDALAARSGSPITRPERSSPWRRRCGSHMTMARFSIATPCRRRASSRSISPASASITSPFRRISSAVRKASAR
jgi:hypothetical protein